SDHQAETDQPPSLSLVTSVGVDGEKRAEAERIERRKRYFVAAMKIVSNNASHQAKDRPRQNDCREQLLQPGAGQRQDEKRPHKVELLFDGERPVVAERPGF